MKQITARQIQQAHGFSELEPVRKVFVRLFNGRHEWPGGDEPLPHEVAVELLQQMATPTTRRSPESAAIAADLLVQITGKEDGEVVVPEQPKKQPHPIETLGPFPKSERRKVRDKIDRKEQNPGGTVGALQDLTAAIQGERKKREPGSFERWLRSITALDIVFAVTILTAIYGLWYNLREMGLAFAVPYSLISFHAMRMAKNNRNLKTARAGIAAVVILEALAFFVHLSMFNLRVVQIAQKGNLPFEYSAWGSLEAPFYIALVLATLFSASGIYSVGVTFSMTKERHDDAEAEAKRAELRKAQRLELLEAVKTAGIEWQLAAGWNEAKPWLAEKYAAKYREILQRVEASGV